MALTWLPLALEDINVRVSFGRRGRNLTMRQRQTGHPEPIGRSSLRSKASKGSSGATASGAAGGGTGGGGEGQRMRRFKDCCRVTLEFTFTQVGVGALVVAYTIMGAFIFQYLETQESDLEIIVFVKSSRRKDPASNMSRKFGSMTKIDCCSIA